MNGSHSSLPAAEPRPRLWPGVVIVLWHWAAIKVPGWIFPGTMEQFMVGMFGSMAAVGLFLIWWLFFSRVRWVDRVQGLAACAAIGAIAVYLFHPTLKGTQPQETMFGLTFIVLPVVFTGWVLWLWLGRSFNRPIRWAGLVAVFMLTWGYFTTLRVDGYTGAFAMESSFRWDPTADQLALAARAANKPAAPTGDVATAKPLELHSGDWPGFRGAKRDGRLTGVRIATDWKQNPPKQLWRNVVGPSWSSFAVIGKRAYTQEQLGGDEIVVCYDADTGAEVWVHKDATRFDETMGGPGPRATPTFHEGRIYAQGANGILNCLDAVTGKKFWSRNLVTDSGAKVPIWGFSASPLVVQGIVTVYAGGPDGKGVLGYRADSGDLAWAAGEVTNTYCSMQPATIDGAEQLVISSREGLTAFDPLSGKVLWRFAWPVEEMYNRVTQPALVGASDFLIGTGFSLGLKRVHVGRDASGWKADEVWETRAIAPYFNDLVIHKDHLYGFHNNLLTCVRLEDGKSMWKERGYDNGQVLLLADQDLLVVQCEISGDVALVEAKPGKRVELGRIPAIKGKTWNHPVVAHGKLFVRNGKEAACFQLTEVNDAGAGGR